MVSVDQVMRWGTQTTIAAFLLGTVAFVTGVALPGDGVVPHVLIMAALTGWCVTWVADPREAVAVVFVGLAFSVVLLHYACAVNVRDVVGHLVPVGFAALLGRGQRWMRAEPGGPANRA